MLDCRPLVVSMSRCRQKGCNLLTLLQLQKCWNTINQRLICWHEVCCICWSRKSQVKSVVYVRPSSGGGREASSVIHFNDGRCNCPRAGGGGYLALEVLAGYNRPAQDERGSEWQLEMNFLLSEK